MRQKEPLARSWRFNIRSLATGHVGVSEKQKKEEGSSYEDSHKKNLQVYENSHHLSNVVYSRTAPNLLSQILGALPP